MSETTKEKKKEVLDYAIEMRERGDRFLTIRNYVDSKIEDKEVVKQIMEVLNRMDMEWKIKTPEQVKLKSGPSTANIVAGAIMIIVGVVLTFILWEAGFVAGLSLIMIVGGIFTMSGARHNFF